MNRFALSSVLAATLFASAPALSMFTGDTKAACEAILCLSTGKRPRECRSAIRRYFSIQRWKLSDTLKARKNFLNLCPSSTEDPKMASLVDSITNGTDRCDYAALNANLIVWKEGAEAQDRYIRGELPGYCRSYYETTNIKPPRYVGTPERGGFWVEADRYAAAEAEYNDYSRNGSIHQTESLQ
ncbi:MAG TPA: TrbM/KikA/MpfK family conjugal transfer protein [Oligoflexus sp.]|uniref:TrbM/KikA/MpfK family conjugal transfer protein n=1 Tax=Oligoflexus sp. TaxID=1971216 RepID=UPI002D807AE2|nr:TrbM/KikA/MpfK family conjugal transfer protein [Oligoflexus sp.]HET9239194.1 TrbM/KikA/MpfK family conjugal transfer protein [Oligoflexus sp.]